MDWEGREESENVEDRRGSGKKVGLAIGGGGGAILIIILALVFGVDPRPFLQGQGGGGQPDGQSQRPADPEEERLRHFVGVVLHDTEVVWDEQFRKIGKNYTKPKLVLFSGEVESACGRAGASVGPFYCPGDHEVYIDLTFYRDLERKLHAPGEFARAYVIAHEVGHHVQLLLRREIGPESPHARNDGDAHQMSVRLELQADYLAGVWAHHADEKYRILQRGDLESAMNAAKQIGDDTLQKQATGTVMPEKFTHGTSEQRMRWFNQGYKTGDVLGAARLYQLRYDEL